MEFATGALSRLLPKLGQLLLEEYNLQKSLKKGIKDLRDELLIIEAALVKVSDVPLDQLDPLVKIWANDVRELSYAIEDSLDSFMVCVEGLEPDKPHTFLGFIKKTCKKVTKLKIRREIANDIKDVKIQVKDVKERYDRYKDVFGNTIAKTEVDPRLLAMYSKVSDFVGIYKPIDELMKVLSEGVDMADGNLKIVSIVGFGGLGKTTLAKALYDKLSKTYECQGFVPVGQNPNTKKVLRDMLLELDMGLYRDAATMDERQLINQLQKFLAGKRYFLVIDDIWDIRTWKTIKCAFVDSHPESRIIITTRIVDVATKAGGIYHMEPLSNDNSKMLLYTRTCGEGVSEDNHPAEVTNKILKKCGGVPLAIITIASLLVGKRTEDWSKVYDAIGFGHEDNEDVHNTRKILSFSYYDLPCHLKTCLLYLSMFPEDRFIGKISLIWRWVSEGFVLDREGIGSFEQGEIYFNELVNKSMIRLIEPDDSEDDPVGCRVHDMVLDLIRTISNEVNFVTIHDMEQHGTYSRGKQTSRVCRLALHGSSAEHKSSIEKEHVRSFNANRCDDSRMLLLLGFKVLRVLVIEECYSRHLSLKHLGKLVQLRYLGLVNTRGELPEGIGHDLKFLEILDVRGGYIGKLPPSVGELQKLRCLWADENTIMKGEIGKLTSLEELQLYTVDECPNFFTELGKLTNLRVLKIKFKECEETACKALAESLCNLHKIQSLIISRTEANETLDLHNRELHVRDGSLQEMALSSTLRFFCLQSIIIPKMPSWIDSLGVPGLSQLRLYLEVVEARDLQTLGRMPSLLVLMLESEEEKCISYTFGNNEFQKLKHLVTNIEITLGEGALPMLQVLGYSASARRNAAASCSCNYGRGRCFQCWDTVPVPWNNSCPLLKEVICRLDCAYCGNTEVDEVVENLEDAARIHTNRPVLKIDRYKCDQEAGDFIDSLEWGLHSLCLPADGWWFAYEEDVLELIASLEALLRDAAEPRVGRYGEQEIRGFVTEFKDWLRDHPDANTEEPDNSDATDSEDDTDSDGDDNDDNNDDTEQEEPPMINTLGSASNVSSHIAVNSERPDRMLPEISMSGLASMDVGRTPDVKPRITDQSENMKTWKLADIVNSGHLQARRCRDSVASPTKVVRLLYTNNGIALLSLGSNAVHKLWKWQRSDRNPNGKSTASVPPRPWRPARGILMRNDTSDGNPEEATACIALSKNDCYVISASGGEVSLFNMMTFKVMTTFMAPPPAATFLAFYPQDNNIIAIGMEDSTIQIYNVRVDEVKIKLKGHQKKITGLAFSQSMNVLVSSGADAQLCVWSIDGWEKKKSKNIQPPANRSAALVGDTRVQFHNDQTHLLVVHESQLAIYDGNLECSRSWYPRDALPAPVSSAIYSCDGLLVYAGFCDGAIGVFEAESLRLRCRIALPAYVPPISSGRSAYPTVVAAHPLEPNKIAVGMSDGAVYVMRTQSWELRLPRTTDPTRRMSLAPAASNNQASDQQGIH